MSNISAELFRNRGRADRPSASRMLDQARENASGVIEPLANPFSQEVKSILKPLSYAAVLAAIVALFGLSTNQTDKNIED